MQVQMTLSIDGREVETWRSEVVGDACRVEERARGFVRGVGNRVVEEGLQRVADDVPRPVCETCRRSMHRHDGGRGTW